MEILHLKYHKGHLLLKALNRADSIKEAARLLGVEERTVYNMMSFYKVKRNVNDDVVSYSSNSKWLDEKIY